MSRGQQGIGISAAGMYGLITTGKPVKIISKTSPKKPAHEVILKMDTSKNRADVVEDSEHPEDDTLFPEGRGTRVEIELVGKYFIGNRSVDEYVQLSAIANPHGRFEYLSPPTSAKPDGERTIYERSVAELPDLPEEIKPHPHGIELGTLIGMLERTSQNQLGGFFSKEFCRIGPKIAQEVTKQAGLTTRSWVKNISHAEAEKLYKGLSTAKVMGPPTNCLSPMGVRTMLKGLESGLQPDFIAASSRAASVYRGRPFVIEAGIAFGGNLPGDDQAKVYRFANRVPLQYQQSACSAFKAVTETAWKNYGLQQPRGGLPTGSLVVMIHMASVWVPFTSESKEAIADYDEIRKEMRLALQECGRKLGTYLRKRKRMQRQGQRRGVFTRYIGEISKACHEITGTDQQALYDALLQQAESKTAEFDEVLDDEGKVVKDSDRLAKDDGVFIRQPTVTTLGASDDDDTTPPPPQSDSDPSPDDSDDDAPSTNLFGVADEPKPKRKTKKKIIKKVKKKTKRSSKAGK